MIWHSSARLGALDAAGPRLLVMGHGVLIGASQQGVSGDGLPAGIANLASDERGDPAAVDVLWDLDTAARSTPDSSTAGRLSTYDGIVVVVSALHVLAASRRIRQNVSAIWPSGGAAPRVVVVLASNGTDRDTTMRAEARIRDLAAGPAPTVLHVDVDPGGGIAEPALVAAAVAQALGFAGLDVVPGTEDGSREVAVDRSLRVLRGRTSHLRRSLMLAQNSFDVPYAQLNLVSRGTLRSLAYIGRSSDGLRRSLSAEAVLRRGPLLIADTHETGRFSDIPEIRGPAAIRYYVGHPVRSSSGHAIGVLCVLDTRPHDIDPGDDVLIRDLALLAEGELAALTGDI